MLTCLGRYCRISPLVFSLVPRSPRGAASRSRNGLGSPAQTRHTNGNPLEILPIVRRGRRHRVPLAANRARRPLVHLHGGACPQRPNHGIECDAAGAVPGGDGRREALGLAGGAY